jgi:predicted O-methyltransferase YrrM
MFEFDNKIIYPKDPSATLKRIKEYKEYYKVKYKLCKDKNPSVIAEIGVRAGYSAWSFLQACPTADYIGFDANNGTHGGQGGKGGRYFEWAKKILKSYNVRLIEADTQTMSSLNINDVDFFHVDGDHSSKGVQHDLDLAYNSINKKGLIVVDDITYINSVRNGVNKWIEKMGDKISHEFVKSLRGEMLIRKK